MVTKPTGPGQRRQRQLWQSSSLWRYLPVLGIVLCLLLFAWMKDSGGANANRKTDKSATQNHNSAGLAGPLDLIQCKHLPQLRICSHQMKGVTTTWGMLAALRELFQMGVRCFDIDIITTSDQQLLVSHPRPLQEVLELSASNGTIADFDTHDYSLRSMRELGANLTAFPSAAEFLEEYARLIRQAVNADDGWHGWDPHRMPFAFLELKGAAYNTDAIDWLWAEVLELGIVNHVAIYVTDVQQPVMLAHQTHWQGLLVRGFKDTMTLEEQDVVGAEGFKASALLSSSINLPESFYHRLKQTGKPLFSWVVDSPLQLRTALSKNVDGIISNDPFFLKLVLKSWWKRCRESQP